MDPDWFNEFREARLAEQENYKWKTKYGFIYKHEKKRASPSNNNLSDFFNTQWKEGSSYEHLIATPAIHQSNIF